MKNNKFSSSPFLRFITTVAITLPIFLFIGFNFTQSPTEFYNETKPQLPFPPAPQHVETLESETKKLPIDKEIMRRCLQTDVLYKKIQSDKEYALSIFFNSGRKRNVPPYEIEQAAMLAGVSIPVFRKAVLNYKDNETSLYRKSNELAQIGIVIPKDFQAPTENGKPAHVQLLTSAMDGKRLSNERWFARKIQLGRFEEVAEKIASLDSVPLVLSQFDPITAAILLNPDISFDELLLLNQAGVPFTLASLASLATREQGADIARDILATSSNLPLQARWKSGFYVVNLLTFALQKNNIQLAQLWFDHGVSPRPIANGVNALDVFPSFSKSHPSETAKALLAQLLNEDIQPYLLETEAKIANWFENNPSVLSDRSLAVQWQDTSFDKREEAVKRIEEMFTMLEKRSINKASVTPAQLKQCKEDEIFQNAREGIITRATTHHEYTMMSPEQRLQRIAGLQLHPLAAPFFEGFMSTLSGLVWNSEDSNQVDLTTPELEELKKQQKINAAIRSFASLEEIISLLEEGYPMSKDAIHVIAQNGRTDLIDPLLNYGLDIEAKNDKGQNALFSALTGFKPFKTFNYLFEEKGLPIINGPELLLHAIQMNAYDKSTPVIVKKLIQEGIKPRQIHWTALVYHVPTGSPAYRKISKLFEQQGKLVFD